MMLRKNEYVLWSGTHKIVVALLQTGEHIWSCWTCLASGRVWVDIMGPCTGDDASKTGFIAPAYRDLDTAIEQSHAAELQKYMDN